MATITEQGAVGSERVPLMDGVAWSQEIDELLPILQEQGIEFRVMSERRSWFRTWLSREPVTAAALGGVVLLLLCTMGFLVLRRPGLAAGMPPGGPEGQAKFDLPPVPPQADAHVVGLSGLYAGRSFPLEADLVFGRDAKSCNVVFPADQDGISSRHCSLRFDAGANAFELRDLGSKNGTFVDGKRINPASPQRLRNGDEFHLFNRECRFAVRSGPCGMASALPAGRGRLQAA